MKFKLGLIVLICLWVFLFPLAWLDGGWKIYGLASLMETICFTIGYSIGRCEQ